MRCYRGQAAYDTVCEETVALAAVLHRGLCAGCVDLADGLSVAGVSVCGCGVLECSRQQLSGCTATVSRPWTAVDGNPSSRSALSLLYFAAAIG